MYGAWEEDEVCGGGDLRGEGSVGLLSVVYRPYLWAAKASPRLRMNLDLRDSAEDGSQRMLNAIEPGGAAGCSSASADV